MRPSTNTTTRLPLHTRLRAVLRHAVADESGQATTEYALVLLGAALVALMLIAWATTGGGSGRIGRLFDSVVDHVISRL